MSAKHSASLRRYWAKVDRGIGLEAMRAATPPGECPFCGDPRAPTITKPHLTCGDPACRSAYQRLYKRDLRARPTAPGVERTIRREGAHP